MPDKLDKTKDLQKFLGLVNYGRNFTKLRKNRRTTYMLRQEIGDKNILIQKILN